MCCLTGKSQIKIADLRSLSGKITFSPGVCLLLVSLFWMIYVKIFLQSTKELLLHLSFSSTCIGVIWNQRQVSSCRPTKLHQTLCRKTRHNGGQGDWTPCGYLNCCGFLSDRQLVQITAIFLLLLLWLSHQRHRSAWSHCCCGENTHDCVFMSGTMRLKSIAATW